ncbi:MAG: pyruvate kinase, partial [Saprospiraceae bacterium]|nr:pyruvate kinase [Saprospiraceae bacterium]
MKKEILFNKTKIIATVGPACDTKEKLQELINAGVDVFRLNFSHGTHEKHQKVINLIRAINKEHHTNTCILQDLQGPKIRTGEVENDGVEIHSGDSLVITTKDVVGNAQKVSTSYDSLASDVEIGDGILIDDGKIELLVEDYDHSDVICRVVHGGMLKPRKGINLPHTNVSAPSLTQKDIDDLELGIANDVEWIALSFVRSAADVLHIKERIRKAGKGLKVIAKIEKPEAVKDIDAIIEAADALMVARGDLGVEILMEEVPMVQKMIANKCNSAFKPVIIATQMMESMIENPRPTRAETNDIANA